MSDPVQPMSNEQLADVREQQSAADILMRAADRVRRFGVSDRSFVGTVAIVAYGHAHAPIDARGGAPSRALDHLAWHLGVKAFIETPTDEAAEAAFRGAAASLRKAVAS